MDIIDLLDEVIRDKEGAEEAPTFVESNGIRPSPFAQRKSLPNTGEKGVNRTSRVLFVQKRKLAKLQAARRKEGAKLRKVETRYDELPSEIQDDLHEQEGEHGGIRRDVHLRPAISTVNNSFKKREYLLDRAIDRGNRRNPPAPRGVRTARARDIASDETASTGENKRRFAQELTRMTPPSAREAAYKSFSNGVAPSPFAHRKALSHLNSGPGGMASLRKDDAIGPEIEKEEKGYQRGWRRMNAAVRRDAINETIRQEDEHKFRTAPEHRTFQLMREDARSPDVEKRKAGRMGMRDYRLDHGRVTAEQQQASEADVSEAAHRIASKQRGGSRNQPFLDDTRGHREQRERNDNAHLPTRARRRARETFEFAQRPWQGLYNTGYAHPTHYSPKRTETPRGTKPKPPKKGGGDYRTQKPHGINYVPTPPGTHTPRGPGRKRGKKSLSSLRSFYKSLG